MSLKKMERLNISCRPGSSVDINPMIYIVCRALARGYSHARGFVFEREGEGEGESEGFCGVWETVMG